MAPELNRREIDVDSTGFQRQVTGGGADQSGGVGSGAVEKGAEVAWLGAGLDAVLGEVFGEVVRDVDPDGGASALVLWQDLERGGGLGGDKGGGGGPVGAVLRLNVGLCGWGRLRDCGGLVGECRQVIGGLLLERLRGGDEGSGVDFGSVGWFGGGWCGFSRGPGGYGARNGRWRCRAGAGSG
jgi:hypothetical protein